MDPSLEGVVFAWRAYRTYCPEWDHDHCEVCGAGFSESAEGDLREGYTTTGDYEQGAEYCWICAPCFEAHQRELAWTVVDDARPVRPLGMALNISSDVTTKPPRLHG